MQDLLATIQTGSDLFHVEASDNGWTIFPQTGRERAFTEMIGELAFRPNDEFAIIPLSDGNLGYERAIVLPL